MDSLGFLLWIKIAPIEARKMHTPPMITFIVISSSLNTAPIRTANMGSRATINDADKAGTIFCPQFCKRNVHTVAKMAKYNMLPHDSQEIWVKFGSGSKSKANISEKRRAIKICSWVNRMGSFALMNRSVRTM